MWGLVVRKGYGWVLGGPYMPYSARYSSCVVPIVCTVCVIAAMRLNTVPPVQMQIKADLSKHNSGVEF